MTFRYKKVLFSLPQVVSLMQISIEEKKIKNNIQEKNYKITSVTSGCLLGELAYLVDLS